MTAVDPSEVDPSEVDPSEVGGAFVAGYLSAILDGLHPADRL
ncbi:hypothetical protein AB0C14_19685 [Microbispora hainanensis]